MKTIIILSMLTICFSAFAQDKGIVCSTPNGEKVVVIKKSQVSFIKTNDQQDAIRSLASIQAVRTYPTTYGYKKVLQHDGNNVTIKVNNVKNFDSSEDYLSFKNSKGHQMTYPIHCSNI